MTDLLDSFRAWVRYLFGIKEQLSKREQQIFKTRPHHIVKSYDLGTARALKKEVIKGDFIYVRKLDGKAEICINTKTELERKLTLTHNMIISTPFEEYYINNDAQTGKTLELWIGHGGMFSVNVPEPEKVSDSDYAGVSVPTGGTLTSILKVVGKGTIIRLALSTTHDDVEFHIYVDGTEIDERAIAHGTQLTATALNTFGYGASTPQVQLTRYTLSGTCEIAMQILFKFLESFEVKAKHSTGSPETVTAGYIIDRNA